MSTFDDLSGLLKSHGGMNGPVLLQSLKCRGKKCAQRRESAFMRTWEDSFSRSRVLWEDHLFIDILAIPFCWKHKLMRDGAPTPNNPPKRNNGALGDLLVSIPEHKTLPDNISSVSVERHVEGLFADVSGLFQMNVSCIRGLSRNAEKKTQTLRPFRCQSSKTRRPYFVFVALAKRGWRRGHSVSKEVSIHATPKTESIFEKCSPLRNAIEVPVGNLHQRMGGIIPANPHWSHSCRASRPGCTNTWLAIETALLKPSISSEALQSTTENRAWRNCAACYVSNGPCSS